MAKSMEWGDRQLVYEMVQLADRCKITVSELEGLAVLKFAKPFRELDSHELHVMHTELKALHSRLNHPAYFDVEKVDTRSEDEKQWDNEVMGL